MEKETMQILNEGLHPQRTVLPETVLGDDPLLRLQQETQLGDGNIGLRATTHPEEIVITGIPVMCPQCGDLRPRRDQHPLPLRTPVGRARTDPLGLRGDDRRRRPGLPELGGRSSGRGLRRHARWHLFGLTNWEYPCWERAPSVTDLSAPLSVQGPGDDRRIRLPGSVV